MLFATPIIEIIDGQEFKFPKIFMADYETLFELQRAHFRVKWAKAVKDGDITADQEKQLRLAMANSAENIFAIQDSVSDPKMATAILECSWRKGGKSVAEYEVFVRDHDPSLVSELAFRVCRKEPEKPKNPDPLALKEDSKKNKSSPSMNNTGPSAESSSVTPAP